MKTKMGKTRGKAGKAMGKAGKRKSAVKRKSSASKTATAKHYMVRTWWILRGAAVGVILLVLLYGGYLGVGRRQEPRSRCIRTEASRYSREPRT